MTARPPDNPMLAELSAYLDDELPPPRRKQVETALRADTKLAQTLGQLLATRALLQTLPLRPAPADLARSVVDRMVRPADDRSPVRWRWWAGVTAAAACVGLVVLARPILRAPTAPVREVAHNAAPTETTVATEESGPSIPTGVDIADAARTAKDNLATRPAGLAMETYRPAARFDPPPDMDLPDSHVGAAGAWQSPPVAKIATPPSRPAGDEPLLITIDSLRAASLGGVQMAVQEFAARAGLKCEVVETPVYEQLVSAPSDELIARMIVRIYRDYRSDVDVVLATDHPNSEALAAAIKQANALDSAQLYADVGPAAAMAETRRDYQRTMEGGARPAQLAAGGGQKPVRAKKAASVEAPAATRPAEAMPFSVRLIYRRS